MFLPVLLMVLKPLLRDGSPKIHKVQDLVTVSTYIVDAAKVLDDCSSKCSYYWLDRDHKLLELDVTVKLYTLD